MFETTDLAELIREGIEANSEDSVLHDEVMAFDWESLESEDFTLAQQSLALTFFEYEAEVRKVEALEKMAAFTERADFNDSVDEFMWNNMASSVSMDWVAFSAAGKKGRLDGVKEKLAGAKDRVMKLLEKLANKVRDFLRDLFDMNDRREKAAEKLLKAIQNRRASLKAKKVRLQGPARYLTSTEGSTVEPMSFDEINEAIQNFKAADLDQIAKDIGIAPADSSPDKVTRLIRRALDGALSKGKGPHGGKKTAYHLIPIPTANVSMLIDMTEEGSWTASTFTDRKATAKADSRKNPLELDCTVDEVTAMLQNAISNFDIIKELKEGIPRADVVSKSLDVEGADEQGVRYRIEFVTRLLIAGGRYGTILSNGAVRIARDYYGAFYRIADGAPGIAREAVGATDGGEQDEPKEGEED